MAIAQTYNTLLSQIRQTLPINHKSRWRNLAWMMSGILWSRSVHLSKDVRSGQAAQLDPSSVSFFA